MCVWLSLCLRLYYHHNKQISTTNANTATHKTTNYTRIGDKGYDTHTHTHKHTHRYEHVTVFQSAIELRYIHLVVPPQLMRMAKVLLLLLLLLLLFVVFVVVVVVVVDICAFCVRELVRVCCLSVVCVCVPHFVSLVGVGLVVVLCVFACLISTVRC